MTSTNHRNYEACYFPTEACEKQYIAASYCTPSDATVYIDRTRCRIGRQTPGSLFIHAAVIYRHILRNQGLNRTIEYQVWRKEV